MSGGRRRVCAVLVGSFLACFALGDRAVSARQPSVTLPSTPLTFGFFTARFDTNGTFTLEGEGWPPFKGTWTLDSAVIVLSTPGVRDCEAPGRYRVGRDGATIRFDLVADDCTPRRMIVDRSTWRPAGSSTPVAERRIVRMAAERPKPLPAPASAAGSWPSFRGPEATGTNGAHNLPDRWNGTRGENILWRTTVPGLGHSSPVVWGQRVFVTSAVSSRGKATFKPGLYGDGDASDDRSPQRWTLYAVDKKSGKILWERVAHEGPPVDTRHMKSTYASATPATDGRLVADSFVIALNADTGETVWKTDRDELPS